MEVFLLARMIVAEVLFCGKLRASQPPGGPVAFITFLPAKHLVNPNYEGI
jgi:hypothetical protein